MDAGWNATMETGLVSISIAAVTLIILYIWIKITEDK